MRRFEAILLILALCVVPRVFGQIDPEKRELLEFGFDKSVEGSAPLEGYGYYYLNQPDFIRSNITLRLAVAPVYVDSEVGFGSLLGPNTDLGIGLAGGGFADTYYQFHNGQYNKDQSFYGHSLEISSSIYHLFDPGKRIPLYGIFRVKEHYSIYARDQTAQTFALPNDHSTIDWRAGLRFGGREPLLHPDLAMELSAWYEGQYRTDSGAYGYNDDRILNTFSQLTWTRALLIYTMPKSHQVIDASVTAGASMHADRLSAYRIGGMLPMAAEYPLMIPGYFENELSARDFVVFNAKYTIPLDAAKSWTIAPMGAIAGVDYLPGLAQTGNFNSGAGLTLGYTSQNGVWQADVTYGYGFEAERSHGRGSQSIALLLQINLGAKHAGGPTQLDHVTGFFLNHF